ncbi:MAG: flavin reductase family protein [Sphingobium sp.]
MQQTIDSARFRNVLGHYPTGVCAVTAVHEGKPAAMIVGSFTSISLDPPLVGFFPDKKSTSWPKIEAAGGFCINVFGAHQLDPCGALAAKAENKFDLVSHRPSPVTGSPLVDDVVAWIDCELHSVVEAGDHWLVMGLVKALEVEKPNAPLLFFQGSYGQFTPLAS